ncbi:hypothetical protein [Romboutsia sp.]|uniref:hypothetical protein n=1 Tax=Romboutsia sp. TaxID=1965302 RepID=UPI003F4159EB
MGRIISNSFIYDLKEGPLSKILKYVKADSTLQMELRKNSLNIYYRGGSLIKIKEQGSNQYKAYFDKNYVTSNASESVMVQCIDGINSIEATKNVIDVIPTIKQQMDFWMSVKKPDGGEREYHHIVAKENNSKNTGKNTDYFICDIEYSGDLDKDKNFKFDMIGVKWPLIKGFRDSNEDLTLCILGMKYGDKSENKIIDYVQDIHKFLGDKEKLENLKKEMEETYKIKSELGLIYPYEKTLIKFSDKIEVIFIFANQNQENNTVFEELKALKEEESYEELCQMVDMKFAKASFMGYGLYENNMAALEELIK